MSDINNDVNKDLPNALPISETTALSPNSGIGITAASETSGEAKDGMGSIGIAAEAIQNNSAVETETYGIYSQVNKEAGSMGDVEGEEISVVNSNPATATVTPEAPSLMNNATYGERIGAGRADEVSGPVSVALDVVNASGEAGVGFQKGVMVDDGAILPDVHGNKEAFVLAPGECVIWYDSAGTSTNFIRADSTSPTNCLNIIFNQNIYVQDNQGRNTHLFSSDGNGNGHISVMQNGSWKTIA